MANWPGAAALPSIATRVGFARKSVQLPFATGATPPEFDAPEILWGTADPNGAVIGSIGDQYIQTADGKGIALWVKSIGATTSDGWFKLGPEYLFHADMFGAKADNATNSTAALVNAYAAAEAARGVLLLSRGIYRYDAKIFDIKNRAGIVGAGKRQTFLQPFSSFTDYAITITNCWRNGTESAVLGSQSLDIATSKAGVFLKGFTICADRNAAKARGIATVGIVDFLFMDDIDLAFLDGTALSLGAIDEVAGQVGTARESRFKNMTVSHCGNLTEQAVNICGGPGVAASDGVNDLYFQNINLSNNRGVHLRIAAVKASAGTRGIFFNNLVVNGDANEAPSPTAADLIVIEGLVACELQNYLISGSATVAGTPYAAVRLKPNASGRPSRVILDGDMSSITGDGFVIDDASVVQIRGTSGVSSPLVELRVAAGALASLQYDVVSPQNVATRNAMIVIGDEAAASRIYGAFRQGGVLTATNGDATPDVKNAEILFLNHSTPINVSDFDNGGRGHTLTVLCQFGSVEPTLVHGNLLLRGARDRVLHQNQAVTFVHCNSSQWLEAALEGGQIIDGWLQDNVAASQTNVELTRAVGRWRATRAGAVIGVVVTATEARTAGTVTVKVFKNTGLAGAAGSVLGTLVAVLDGTNPSRAAGLQYPGPGTYAMGDELYITVTTDAGWLPITSDIRCALEVVF